ncbi:hypothetical protein L1987_74390 [Smallanthus sonchifolius]|uniref:Uncharacterized protein n=1 Tax=Smallanthus sonchifolius TaxID=185202 RepID=A0ACB9A3J7_9ASTR|nr:hypothetical protein L1987_74390 [Smallanthus sonchifolius]
MKGHTMSFPNESCYLVPKGIPSSCSRRNHISLFPKEPCHFVLEGTIRSITLSYLTSREEYIPARLEALQVLMPYTMGLAFHIHPEQQSLGSGPGFVDPSKLAP